MAKQIINPIATKISLFKADFGTDKNLQTTFAKAFETHNGDWLKIKAELKPENGFSDAIVQKLNFTHAISTWSNDNTKLVEAFQKDIATNSMRDIALKLNKADFISKVKDASVLKKDTEKVAFAEDLRNSLFHLEPTAMLINMVKDPAVPFFNDAVGGNIAKVLENQSDFNIKTTSVYELFKAELIKDNIDKVYHY